MTNAFSKCRFLAPHQAERVTAMTIEPPRKPEDPVSEPLGPASPPDGSPAIPPSDSLEATHPYLPGRSEQGLAPYEAVTLPPDSPCPDSLRPHSLPSHSVGGLTELFEGTGNVTKVNHPSVTRDEQRTTASGNVVRELPVGQRFGDYELLEVIGRGGMGVVYRARQVSLDRIVAVKMILAGCLASEADVRRFEVEAQAAARMDHPHIVTIYQIGEIDGHHFFSMDYIEGSNLAEHCRSGPLEARRAARYLQIVAQAVHAAHEEGILHRDLKPANILIDRADRPWVTDFGLAKHLDGDAGLTATGVAIGTPSYMPPEQAAGRWNQVGPASDVYSLGAILYVMLTGQPPFRADSMVQTLLSVVHQEPTPPRQLAGNSDPILEIICLKCLRKNPADRYASAQELADDLGRYLRDEPILAQPRSLLGRGYAWIRDVPLVAALLGRPLAEPKPAHYRAQAAFIFSTMIFVVLAVLAFRVAHMPSGRLPATISLAAGREGGMYSEFGRQLADRLEPLLERPVRSVPTSGSVENRELLRDGQVQLALLQAGLLKGDEVSVVAPVFHEVVHVIVRSDRPIHRLSDLEGRKVCLGEVGSGSRITAEVILRYYGLHTQSTARNREWQQFFDDPEMDAAMVTVGLGNRFLVEALSSGDFRLLSLPAASDWGDRTLEPCRVGQERYPQAIEDPEGLTTLRTPAFLVTQPIAPDRLVRQTLEALYQMDPADRISRATAASWSFLPWHRAAREFLEAPP
jgi:eukaryotic-like serine/threonine-protein kinase